MSFIEKKITAGDIASQGVQSKPNKLTGTAAENKAAFDNLVTAVVREKFNAFLEELMGAGAAAQIGVDTIGSLTAGTVQEALQEMDAKIGEYVLGEIPDGSISTAKYANGSVTTAKIAALAVTGALIAAGAVSTEKIADGAVSTAKIAALAVTSALIASGAVTAEKLSQGAVTAEKIASAAVDSTKLAAGAATTAKIADGAVTAAKLASSLTYAAVNLESNQVRPIFVTDTAPTSASADGIYLVYEE